MELLLYSFFPDVSFLGHLCGILAGYLYLYLYLLIYSLLLLFTDRELFDLTESIQITHIVKVDLLIPPIPPIPLTITEQTQSTLVDTIECLLRMS